MEGGMGDERERGRGELTVAVGRIRTRSLLMRFISWRIFEGEEEGVRKERGGREGNGNRRYAEIKKFYIVHCTYDAKTTVCIHQASDQP